MTKPKGLAGLRFYRQRAGLTQAELAERLDISRASVVAWERGAAWPMASMLPLMADVLLCQIEDLYSEHNTDGGECPWPEDVDRSTQDTGGLPV